MQADLNFRQIEVDLIFIGNGKRSQLSRQMEDNFNFLDKWKMTSTFEANGIWPQFLKQTEYSLNVNGKPKITSTFVGK